MSDNAINTPDKHPILYSFRRCPYAMRARLSLYYAGITVELREVVLKDKPEPMLTASPKGTVPVLIPSKDKVIDESYDIMHWALSQKDPQQFYVTDLDETNDLVARNDNEFKKALDRYKYPNRYPDEDCSNARDICEAYFADLNARLEKHRYLMGPELKLADIAIFPFVRQAANVDKYWFEGLDMPRLHQWVGEHTNSKAFSAVMPKFDQWKEGQPPLLLAPWG